MEMQKIRKTLFGLLMIGLLAGMAPDAQAQRTASRSDTKRPGRTAIKKEKIVKRSSRKRIRKNRISESNLAKSRYRKNENRKKQYRGSKRGGKSYERHINNAYMKRGRKHYFPIRKTWHRGLYRRPAWVDYHRPGSRYLKIGMHVSILPYGYISFVIGNLRFYAYRGIYYRYDPVQRVYIVVNKPGIETCYTSATWDKIILMDGSTIEGVYRYSDNDMAFFEVGDALLEIPMSEIKVLFIAEN